MRRLKSEAADRHLCYHLERSCLKEKPRVRKTGLKLQRDRFLVLVEYIGLNMMHSSSMRVNKCPLMLIQLEVFFFLFSSLSFSFSFSSPQPCPFLSSSTDSPHSSLSSFLSFPLANNEETEPRPVVILTDFRQRTGDHDSQTTNKKDLHVIIIFRAVLKKTYS